MSLNSRVDQTHKEETTSAYEESQVEANELSSNYTFITSRSLKGKCSHVVGFHTVCAGRFRVVLARPSRRTHVPNEGIDAGGILAPVV